VSNTKPLKKKSRTSLKPSSKLSKKRNSIKKLKSLKNSKKNLRYDNIIQLNQFEKKNLKINSSPDSNSQGNDFKSENPFLAKMDDEPTSLPNYFQNKILEQKKISKFNL
jgi:hypothetical protein